MLKIHFFDERKKKKLNVNILQYCSNLYSERGQLNRDSKCSKLERYGEEGGDKKSSVEHTLFIVYHSSKY